MRVDIVVDPVLAHHGAHAQALSNGLARHRISARIITSEQPVETDIAACWSWGLARPLVRQGKQVLVMERGYIGDRMRWASLAWNGLNGRGTFGRQGAAGRFEQNFAGLMQPWRPGGDYALLIGQVPGDSSLEHCDIDTFYAGAARTVTMRLGLPVKFRPHPFAIEHGIATHVAGTETIGGSLAEALSGAAVVITWNSNTAVESVLFGKPTITFDLGSLAWPVTAHDIVIHDLEPGRHAWAETVAWRQWSMDEISDGTAWEYLEP